MTKCSELPNIYASPIILFWQDFVFSSLCKIVYWEHLGQGDERIGEGFEGKKRRIKKRLECAQIGWKHIIVITKFRFHDNRYTIFEALRKVILKDYMLCPFLVQIFF